MIDDADLRSAARSLQGWYKRLDAAKNDAAQPRGERVMRPSPGPRPPGNFLLMSLDRDLTSRLFEFVRDAANHIAPAAILHHRGDPLCDWIALNSFYVAELDFAEDILDEIHDQIRRISRRLEPPGADVVANRPEPRHISGVVIDRLSGMGHKVTREQLRTWAARGYITSEARADGRATYKMTEILNHITKQQEAAHAE